MTKLIDPEQLQKLRAAFNRLKAVEEVVTPQVPGLDKLLDAVEVYLGETDDTDKRATAVTIH